MKTQITVLFFAQLKERFGLELLKLDLPAGARAGDVFKHLDVDEAEQKELCRFVRLAVNHAYVDQEHALKSGDTVALIPPVSGG